MVSLLCMLCQLLLISKFIIGASLDASTMDQEAMLNNDEMNALQDLYESTNGVDWSIVDGNPWNFTSGANPCTNDWMGIYCVLPDPYDTYYVANITLSDRNLLGTLPDSLASFSRLVRLDLSDNHLTNTIPDSVGDMVNLQYLIVDYNKLSGTVPNSLGALAKLVKFSARSGIDYETYLGARAYNTLSGTLPAELLWNNHIVLLDLRANCIQGALPAPPAGWIAGSSKLVTLVMPYNFLSGTLPVQFAQLTNLANVALSINYLSGTLEQRLPGSLVQGYLSYNMFGGTIPPSLFSLSNINILNLNNNLFSGALPESFASLPHINQLILSFNCFQGKIPAGFCEMESLQDLSLTCLSCAPPCTSHLLTHSGYIQHHPVSGIVPPCLFQMPNLTDLNLPYNALTGTLPHDQLFSPTLENIDLSCNMLSGTIPRNIGTMQGGPSLDYNRFTGNVLLADLSEYYYLDAEYNRLSGRVAQNLVDLSYDSGMEVYMLKGNIFECSSNGGGLPKTPHSEQTVGYQCGSNGFNNTYTAWIVSAVTVAATIAGVLYGRHTIEKYVGVEYALAMLTRWYTAATTGKYVSTAVHHVWDVTTVLCKTGLYCAAIAVFVLAPVYAILSAYYGTYTYQYAWTVSNVLLSGKVPFALMFLLFLLVLSVMVVCFKTSGVQEKAAARQTTTNGYKVRVFAVCALYVLTNMLVVGAVNASFVGIALYADPVYQLYLSAFKVIWNLLCSPYLTRLLVYECSASRVDFFILELVVSLMNNVGIPLACVIVVSPQCLFNLYCSAFWAYGPNADCHWPYTYYYQCSYVYINYYAAAFIFVSIFTSFGQPLIELSTQQLHRRAHPGTLWYRLLDRILPRILKPIESEPALMSVRNVFTPYFDATQFLVSQLTFLALILTLGVVVPPLALALAVTMVATAAYTVLKVGRFITNAVEAKQMKYVDMVEQDVLRVASPKVLRRAAWILLYFSCCFMTLFLFDTLGDAVGFQKAYWTLIVVPLLPMIAHLVKSSVQAVRARSGDTETTVDTSAEPTRDNADLSSATVGLEMGAVVSPMASG